MRENGPVRHKDMFVIHGLYSLLTTRFHFFLQCDYLLASESVRTVGMSSIILCHM
jgi:hypothetical protein